MYGSMGSATLEQWCQRWFYSNNPGFLSTTKTQPIQTVGTDTEIDCNEISNKKDRNAEIRWIKLNTYFNKNILVLVKKGMKLGNSTTQL
jgi:hypothetical protein